MDKTTRDTLRKMVAQCRTLLEDATSDTLEGRFGIHLKTGKVDDASQLGKLDEHDLATRTRLLAQLEHIRAHGVSPTSSVEQLIREISFTHLNRICAYKMMEKRGLIRETVSRGMQSTGVSWFRADHPEEDHLWNLGRQAEVYRHFLEWTGHERAKDVAALFDAEDPANGVFPSQAVIDNVLALVNAPELEGVWDEDETVGWVYQYFTPKELRDKARKESAAPRNSYELAFRNQFFTPRYVVEFLVDNTLGRTWYEMNQGRTQLREHCKYLVRRYDEVFLADQAAWTRPGHLTTDAEFLLDKVDELAPFAVGDEHHLSEFGRAVYVKTQSVKPVDEVEHIVRQWNDGAPEDPVEGTTQDLWELLAVLATPERVAAGKVEPMMTALTRIANEIRRRLLQARRKDLSTAEALKAPELIPFRAWKDPRELRIADIASGSGHFLLYCFDLLETIYHEAYDDAVHGVDLRKDYPTRADLDLALPGLILGRNLHGVDIDLRACQIASLALWLRAQRSYKEAGVMQSERPTITKANIIWVAPMPGEKELLDEFLGTVESEDLRRLVKEVFEGMQQAGDVGSLLAMETDISAAIKRVIGLRGGLFAKEDRGKWQLMHTELMKALTEYSDAVSNGERFKRTLFANDTAHGLSYIDLCETKMDVMLMNPPFGDPSTPSKKYIESHYPRTKNDLYAAFVERGIQWLVPHGMLGAISSRTGFFLTSFQKWREEIILGEARPTVFADLGYGVLDTAMVETAAYCLEKNS
jgi:hypothetical protein